MENKPLGDPLFSKAFFGTLGLLSASWSHLAPPGEVPGAWLRPGTSLALRTQKVPRSKTGKGTSSWHGALLDFVSTWGLSKKVY